MGKNKKVVSAQELVNKLDPDKIQCYSCKRYINKEDSEYVLNGYFCKDTLDCMYNQEDTVDRRKITDRQIGSIQSSMQLLSQIYQ